MKLIRTFFGLIMKSYAEWGLNMNKKQLKNSKILRPIKKEYLQ